MSVIDTVPARRGFRLTGWHVLAMVVAFFAIVVGLDCWFAVLAVQTFPGEVSKTAYEDGLKYNQTLDARDAQVAAGWRLAVDAGPAPGQLQVRAADAAGGPLEGLVLTGVLSRPATLAGEKRLSFTLIAPGRYEARTAPLRGVWDLTLTGHDSKGRSIQAERRLSWP